ncbi:unnamed protein product, partial [Prorocentrum cordatum]
NQREVQKWHQEVQQLDLPTALARFPFVKVQNAHETDKVKILLVNEPPLKALTDCLEQLGAVKKVGVAPMNHLERVFQTFLSGGEME